MNNIEKIVFNFLFAMLFCFTLKAQLTDKESNNYKTKVIQNQEWMIENLKSTKLNNGKKIALAKNSDEWMSYCEKKLPCYTYYNFDEKYKNYGLVYNYFAAHHKDLVPKGWEMPTTDQWSDLIFNNGKFDEATAIKLKDKTTWMKRPEQYNESGFSAKAYGYLKLCGNFTDNDYKNVSYWRIDTEDEEAGANACSFSINDNTTGNSIAFSYSGNTAGSYIRFCKTLEEPEEDEEEADKD
jgi:uncharacterized protein (TIGR02145 family)